MPSNRRRIGRALIAVSSLGLAGCQDHFARMDTVTPWSGDAPAANAAMETINPFPATAYDARVTTQGSKAEDAMKVYRLPPANPSTAPATSEVAPSAGGATGGSTGVP